MDADGRAAHLSMLAKAHIEEELDAVEEFKEMYPGAFPAAGESYVAALARKGGDRTGPEWYYGTNEDGYNDAEYNQWAQQGTTGLEGDPHRGDSFGRIPPEDEEEKDAKRPPPPPPFRAAAWAGSE